MMPMNSLSLPNPPTPSRGPTSSTFPQPSSYLARPRLLISQTNSARTLTHTTSRPSGARCRALHRFHIGSTERWSCWAGTKPWRSCSIRCISHSYYLHWLHRKHSFPPVNCIINVFTLSRYITIQLGLVGPLFQVLRTVGAELQRQAAARLREQFAEPAPAHGSPVRSQSYSDDTDNDSVKEELRSRQL